MKGVRRECCSPMDAIWLILTANKRQKMILVDHILLVNNSFRTLTPLIFQCGTRKVYYQKEMKKCWKSVNGYWLFPRLLVFPWNARWFQFILHHIRFSANLVYMCTASAFSTCCVNVLSCVGCCDRHAAMRARLCRSVEGGGVNRILFILSCLSDKHILRETWMGGHGFL